MLNLLFLTISSFNTNKINENSQKKRVLGPGVQKPSLLSSRHTPHF